MKGLENCDILRPDTPIGSDYFDPRALKSNFKKLPNGWLFCRDKAPPPVTRARGTRTV